MLTQIKIQKMYDIAIESFKNMQSKNDLSHDITTRDLRNCGMNNHDIAAAIAQGYISRVIRGHYNIANTDEIVKYGVEQIRENKSNDLSVLLF